MKRILITGAGGAEGIGRAIAEHLLIQGNHVVAVDVDQDGLAELDASHDSKSLQTFSLDLSDAKAVEQFVGEICAGESIPDVLINNAATTRFASVLDTSTADWDAVMSVNLKAPFILSRGLAGAWIAGGIRGVILNVVSVNAGRAKEMIVPYCASKAALKLLTEGMAVELGAHGIRVNALAPGDTQTGIVRQPEVREALLGLDFAKGVPLGRRGLPQDMVAAAAFLISDQAEFITGSTLTVDGGASAGEFFPVRLKS